jgi:protein arginine N-methyltransferase 1
LFISGPLAIPTHWKQTVFYLPQVLFAKEGEVITGTLTCSPNAGNPRDLDFVISYEFNGKAMQSKASGRYKMR